MSAAMRLRWSPTSPFSRKVLVLIKEKGADGAIALERSNPLSREDRAATPNPLGKIPCLVTAGGGALYDSPVIMQYLDAVLDGPRMLAADGPERWTALRRGALADGMIGAAVACYVEGLRKPERRSEGWIAHNRAVALAGAAALGDEALGDGVDIGSISAAVALDFLDQQFPGEDWRAASPRLAGWFGAFSERPSMAATRLSESFG